MNKKAVVLVDECDVYVVPRDSEICACGEDRKTHVVFIDFGNTGLTTQIGEGYCHTCADDVAKTIKEGIGRKKPVANG
jgi:hypothetical protein